MTSAVALALFAGPAMSQAVNPTLPPSIGKFNPGLNYIGGGSGATTPIVGNLFLVNGTDPVFLVDGASGLCLTGGGC